jgi:hypothetical protein
VAEGQGFFNVAEELRIRLMVIHGYARVSTDGQSLDAQVKQLPPRDKQQAARGPTAPIAARHRPA